MGLLLALSQLDCPGDAMLHAGMIGGLDYSTRLDRRLWGYQVDAFRELFSKERPQFTQIQEDVEPAEQC
jgi:hypothetical protein